MRQVLISACFCLFVLAPWLAGLAGVRAEALENRRVAARPEWTLASWLDTDAYTALGDWLADVLPLRAESIALDSWIDYAILGDSPSARVLIGVGGELFLDSELSSACVDGARLDTAALSRLGSRLGAQGVELYLLLSPNKASLYPERVPPAGVPLRECGDVARRELREQFRSGTTFVPVQLWDVFEAEARAGQRLFPRLGRHWDGYGGIVQARVLVNAIQPGLWDERAVSETGTRTLAAELPSRFMNLEIEETQPTFAVVRPGVRVEQQEFQLAPDSREPGLRTSATSQSAGLIPGRTLVVNDSFMRLSIDAFAAYAERVTFVPWTQLVLRPDAVARELASADRLVLQLVEDRAGVELGRHVGGVLRVQDRHEALRAHEARVRDVSRQLGDTPR